MVEIDFYITTWCLLRKKYADDWGKKVLQAGRNYFEFNQNWTDDYIKKKIKTGRNKKKDILVMMNY